MSGGFTLGHFLIGVAIVDVIAVLLMVRGWRRDNPAATEEQRRAVRLIVGAAFVAAVGLVLIGLFLPDAQMRIL